MQWRAEFFQGVGVGYYRHTEKGTSDRLKTLFTHANLSNFQSEFLKLDF
jgi:hypothetical protein